MSNDYVKAIENYENLLTKYHKELRNIVEKSN